MPFPDLAESVAERVAAARARVRDAVARGGHGQPVRIVAVTKTHGPEAVRAAHAAGLVDVGENKVQEALDKIEATRDVPVAWHLIGHLQRNKVKYLDPFALVHSLDSDRLADALAAWGAERGRPAEVLVQVNVSGEATKGGFAPGALPVLADRLATLEGLRVRGVMTMAPYDAPEKVQRAVFAGARDALAVLRAGGHPADELSMGMSGDYEVAVEEGATLVRLGTTLFGARS